jgi:hypothetical protein
VVARAAGHGRIRDGVELPKDATRAIAVTTIKMIEEGRAFQEATDLARVYGGAFSLPSHEEFKRFIWRSTSCILAQRLIEHSNGLRSPSPLTPWITRTERQTLGCYQL